MEPSQIRALREAVLRWYGQHGRDLPWRRTEDPYAIVVAEVMLQQTQVERVLPKYRAFLERFPHWRALAEAARGEVIRQWAGLGYNARAVRLHELARRLIADHGGRLPEDGQTLRRLPGLGPYTSAAVQAFVHRQPVAVIDTNVRRVLGRALLGVCHPRPGLDRALRPLAVELVPEGRAAVWHHALMDLGATVCLARRPACERCPIEGHCRARSALMEGTNDGGARGRRQGPYRGSRRYYRGRFVEALRALPQGGTVRLEEVGPQVREDFRAEDRPWLEELARQLLRDGLVRYDAEAGTVGLP
jgi:A/G-specific adenine glycosylase